MHPSLNQHPVVRDFFWLTKFTSPHGTESRRFGKLFDTLGAYTDDHGNYILDIDVDNSTTVFAAHLDTADYKGMQRVRRKVKGNTIRTDGKTILGADNRAGIAVLLHLIRNEIPGRYIFFVGEEIGRVGSEASAKDPMWTTFDRIICWDRFGKSSIVTHQMGMQTCSDDFADALADEYRQANPTLRLMGDDGGSYTDSYSFIDSIPECTNISVGYCSQHTTHESQDASFLVDIAEASVSVDWESLPTVQSTINRESLYTWYADYAKYDSLWKKRSKPAHSIKAQALNRFPDDSNEDWPFPATQDDVLYSATMGALTREDVENFVYHETDEAVQLFYDMLTGMHWGA